MSEVACEVDQYCQPAGQQIYCVRWLKSSSHNVGIPAANFVTLNSDCQNDSSVVLWKVLDSCNLDDTPRFYHLSRVALPNTPTALQCVSEDLVVVGDNAGCVHVVSTGHAQDTLNIKHTHNALHQFNNKPALCNQISAWASNNVVTCGEDGCIRLLDINQSKAQSPIRLGSSVLCVAHSTPNTVICGSLDGLIQVVDLRASAKDCIVDSRGAWCGGSYSTCSISCHPAQTDVIVAGSDSGVVALCDLRMPQHFVSTTNIHSGPVLQVMFHQSYTDHLFSCSSEGSLLHIDGSAVSFKAGDSERGSIWTGNNSSMEDMQIVNLIPEQSLPVNSFHVSCRNIICATDSETIILTSNLMLA